MIFFVLQSAHSSYYFFFVCLWNHSSFSMCMSFFKMESQYLCPERVVGRLHSAVIAHFSIHITMQNTWIFSGSAEPTSDHYRTLWWIMCCSDISATNVPRVNIQYIKSTLCFEGTVNNGTSNPLPNMKPLRKQSSTETVVRKRLQFSVSSKKNTVILYYQNFLVNSYLCHYVCFAPTNAVIYIFVLPM